jgi:phosphoglycerol transferase
MPSSLFARWTVPIVTGAVVCAALAFFMRWDHMRWDVPWEYDGDALFMHAVVRTALEQPWYLDAPRLGAPHGLRMYDYPCADTLDILLVKFIGLFEQRPSVVFNLIYVLSFPLAAWVMLAAARRLGLSWPAAMAAAVLFAFLPYHALRGERHLFLSTYFPIPLIVTVLVEIATGRLPFLPETETGQTRFRLADGNTLRAVLIAALLGAVNPYYAYFSLLLLPCAGLIDLLTRGRWWGLFSSLLLGGVLAASATINSLPSLIDQFRHGRNPLGHARIREDAENYGLKLSHMLLPAPHHRSEYGPSVERFYHSSLRPLENENRMAALGAVAAVGFVGFLLAVLVRRPKDPPWITALAQLNLVAFLLGTMGGIGVLANLLYSQFRCYNRLSIFIACFALLALGGWADLCRERFRDRWPRRLVLAVLAAVVVFGVWDGATRLLSPDPAAALRWDADAAFVHHLEQQVPPGSRVFQLPVVPFPESPAVEQMPPYQSLIGYLHSTNLEWSAGAMRGRETAAWQADMAKRLRMDDTREAALAELERSGFRVLWVDWSGYAAADRIELRTQLEQSRGEPIAARTDGTTTWYRLGP